MTLRNSDLFSSAIFNFLKVYWIDRPRASLVAQSVKNLPAMQETWVWSLGWEGPLEEGMAAHPVFLPRECPWTEEAGGLQSMGSQRARHDWVTKHRKQQCVSIEYRQGVGWKIFNVSFRTWIILASWRCCLEAYRVLFWT